MQTIFQLNQAHGENTKLLICMDEQQQTEQKKYAYSVSETIHEEEPKIRNQY